MNTTFRTELVEATSFGKFASLLRDIKEDVSFLGGRYVYVDRYQDTLHLHALPLHTMYIASKKKGVPLDNIERAALDIVVQKVNSLMNSNDTRLINPFTSFMRSIRDQCEYILSNLVAYDLRFRWDHNIVGFLLRSSRRDNFPKEFISQVIKRDFEATLVKTITLSDLLSIVQEVKADISFLGRCYINVYDFDGTLPLSALTKRVINIAKKTPGFRQENDFQEIVRLIDALYVQNDTIKTEKNPLTRVICAIRDVWDKYVIQDNARLEWDANK